MTSGYQEGVNNNVLWDKHEHGANVIDCGSKLSHQNDYPHM